MRPGRASTCDDAASDPGDGRVDVDFVLRDFDGVCRLFPLPGVVLFPHAVLPLHIFEPRYRQMTEEALATDRLVAIVQVLSDPRGSSDSEPPIADVACLGKILRSERLHDGRFNFLLQGVSRVRIIDELNVATLYRQARVEVLEEIEPLSDTTDEIETLVGLFREVAQYAGGSSDEIDEMTSSGLKLGAVADLIVQSLGLPAGLKQSFLDDRIVERRATGLTSLLRQIVGQIQGKNEPPRSYLPPFSQN